MILETRSCADRSSLRSSLVLHRRGDRAAPVAQSRVFADEIAGAELVEREGRSHLPAIGDAESAVAHPHRRIDR